MTLSHTTCIFSCAFTGVQLEISGQEIAIIRASTLHPPVFNLGGKQAKSLNPSSERVPRGDVRLLAGCALEREECAGRDSEETDDGAACCSGNYSSRLSAFELLDFISLSWCRVRLEKGERATAT